MSKYTEEKLKEYVKESLSWADVCRKFGVRPASGSQCHLKKLAIRYSINISHFTGQAWRKGKYDYKKKNALEYCFKDSTIKSSELRLKLIRDGYKNHECELCKVKEWMGEPIVLELDHKNSNHTDNTFDNLQIICPNCHALLTRNRRKASRKTNNKSWDNPSFTKIKIKRKKRKFTPGIKKRKVSWPTKEELQNLMIIMNWTALGKKFGVSDNAVRKWAKQYGLI